MTDSRFVAPRLVVTDDGSHSVRMPSLGEQYHSSHGAIVEAQTVFLRYGYEHALACRPEHLRILEVGFGTGLNALLTWNRNRCERVSVSYTALEPWPLPCELIAQLNYGAFLEAPAPEIFVAMHGCAWGRPQFIGERFSLLKRRTSLEQFEPSGLYDLVFYDAFSPAVQPELWTAGVFGRISSYLSPGAVLVTYCAKGTVKRSLKAAGFALESLPGPPGKREVSRATKPWATA